MRMDLKVPFTEKDEAKKLGARWDATRKIWYVMDQADLAPFARWSPSPQSHEPARAAPVRARTNQAASLVIVGSQYQELPRVCDCLPWETCPRCQDQASNIQRQ